MALFIRQDDERSELQKQIAAELHRKAAEKTSMIDRPDGVDDSQYIKGSKTSSRFVWVWFVGVLIAAVVIIWLTVVNMAR